MTDLSAQPIINYPWYAVFSANEKIQQGDFFDNFPILTPDIDFMSNTPSANVGEQIRAKILYFDVIVMTQSCDLDDMPESGLVILCPRHSIEKATTATGKSLNDSDGWGKLVRGSFVSNYLLNKCEIENYNFDYQVVDLSRVFSVPLKLFKNIAQSYDTRIRLLPPYREHLSQAFARQFMRVGLPIDLPRKYPYK